MYAKQGNLVDAGASGANASTKHLESRLEFIQGHAVWDHWNSDDGLGITVVILILHRFRDIADFCAHDRTLYDPNFWGVPVAPDRPYWGQPEYKP